MKKVKPKNNQRNNQYCAHLLFPTTAHTPTNKPCLNGGERNSKQRKNYSVIQKTGKEWKVRLIHTRQRRASVPQNTTLVPQYNILTTFLMSLLLLLSFYCACIHLNFFARPILISVSPTNNGRGTSHH